MQYKSVWMKTSVKCTNIKTFLKNHLCKIPCMNLFTIECVPTASYGMLIIVEKTLENIWMRTNKWNYPFGFLVPSTSELIKDLMETTLALWMIILILSGNPITLRLAFTGYTQRTQPWGYGCRLFVVQPEHCLMSGIMESGIPVHNKLFPHLSFSDPL